MSPAYEVISIQPVMSVLVCAEEEKIKYTPANKDTPLSRFTPLVVSVDGVFAPQMSSFFKVDRQTS